MQSIRSLRIVAALCVLAAMLSSAQRAAGQQQAATLDKDSLYQISQMLMDAHDEVKKHYYDPKFQGLDWDARYKEHQAMLPKARNLGEGFRVVAAFLGGLNDSHVFFIPPSRANHYDEGYEFGLVGDNCFITQIRPGSDAESKLHVGDQLITMDGFSINPQDFEDLSYFYRVLSPMPAAQMVLRSSDGKPHTVIVNHVVRPGRKQVDLTESQDYYDLVRQDENDLHARRARLVEMGDVAIWKLQRFNLDITEVEKFINTARKHKTLILDLRGDPGGRVDTLKVLIGLLFDKEIKIADRVERKDTKAMIAKRQGNPFTGKLIVLVDAASASASELLARVVQIEHRGTVIGDKSAGAVMESRHFDDNRGADTKIFYGFSVTEANLIMTDGKSLEKVGVTPDEVVLPTGADLTAGRDPVMARAVEMAGGKLDSVEAAKLFPFEWTPVL